MYTRSAGTLAFAAPERFLESNIGYTNKVDIWSSGIILFMLLIGYHPFDHFGSIANLIK
jgi:serine/threonine protein kinase